MTIVDRFQVQALRPFGAQDGFIATAVGRAHVIDIPGRGPLPPVLLMHGLASAAADFYPLIRRLRHHVRRILAVDMPGHGLSDTPRVGMSADSMQRGLLEALDRLLEEPMAVFGSSMGGMAAVRYAALRPHRVHSLFLSSPGGGPMPPDALRDLTTAFQPRRLADARGFLARAMATSHPLHPLMAWGLRERTRRPALRQLLDNLDPAHLLHPDELAGLSMPVLLSWGQREAILPPTHLDFWRRYLPAHARIEEPRHHGHMPFVTHVDEVVLRHVRFLAEESG